MIPRNETKDFSWEMIKLHRRLTLISDKMIKHINAVDPKINLRPNSLFFITRKTQGETFYQIDLMSGLLEKTLIRWLNKYKVPFEIGFQGIFIDELALDMHPLAYHHYADLSQQIDDELNAAPVETNKPKSPVSQHKLFDRETKPLIEKVYVGWAQQQKEAMQSYRGDDNNLSLR